MTAAHPVGLSYGLAVVMVGVSLYCVGRLALARHLRRRNRVDVSLAHALMGVGMAGMLVPAWNAAPAGLFEVVFAAVGLWFGAAAVVVLAAGGRRRKVGPFGHSLPHHLIHLVMALAMVYMYALGASQGPAGTMAMTLATGTAADTAGLTLLLVVVLAASAVWHLDAMARLPRTALAGAGEPSEAPWLAPRLEMACHVAMCLTMAYMLVLAL